MQRIAQTTVGVVFALNVTCAIAFIAQPESYTGAFEIEGLQGRVLVQALGILFLMWNVTYPLVIFNPVRYRVLFGIVLAQQIVGLVGESAMWLTLPTGHPALASTGLRFIFFDGIGLVALGITYWLLRGNRQSK